MTMLLVRTCHNTSARRVVKRLEIAIEVAREHQSAAGREHCAGAWRALPVRPRGRMIGEFDCIDAADLAVAVGHHSMREYGSAAARIGLPRGKGRRRRVGAVLVERHEERAGLRIVGGRRPAATTHGGWACHDGLTDMRDRDRVDGLFAGLGIDRRHHVLRHRLFVPQPLAVGAVERLDDARACRP